MKLVRGSVVPAGGKTDGYLLDAKPIKLTGFTLHARSVEVHGKPSQAATSAALAFASAAHEGSPYWIGDILSHVETREEWQETRSQVLSVTGLAEQTVANLLYVGRHVAPAERALAPSLAHAAEVASLEQPEQSRLLSKAKTEGWTRRELRDAIKAESRVQVLSGQAPEMHTVDVTVQVTVEAASAYAAEQAAWSTVREACSAEAPGVKVIAAKARTHGG